MKQYKDWGWPSGGYKKTGWVFEGGKQYIGTFWADGISITAEIRFVAKRPVKAMKYIVDKLNSGASIESLADKIIYV